jgi:hypothetical protein
MRPSEDYLGVVTPEEIERLYQSLTQGAGHPLIALAKSEAHHEVKTNTERAARRILRANPDWMPKLKARLIDTSDLSNASSALGEIRAYGALLDTDMAVKPNPAVPGKKVLPEFDVDGGVIVEVHSRQLDPMQAQALATHRAMHYAEHKIAVQEAKKAGEAGVVTSSAIGVMPLGAPDRAKAGDSILTNAISRICGIKKDEKQIDPAKPFVLWLDLQDPLVWGGSLSEEQFAPIYTESKDGAVGTGALWFALYGRKGDPMIEMFGLEYHQTAMLHDGRFALSAKISAVVFSLSRATVLMEHPSAAMPLPARFRGSLLKAPFFRLDLSLCEWSRGLVRSQTDLGRELVAQAAQALTALNPGANGRGWLP